MPDGMVKGGRRYRLLTDHLGSVGYVVDLDTGEVVQALEHDEWGKVLKDTNPGFQPFGYAGGLYDADTGLVRFGARDYDPREGRWLTKDPIGLEGGYNVYTYVGGNPISRVDPSGRSWVTVIEVAAIAYAAYRIYDFFHEANQLGQDAQEFGNALDDCARNPNQCDANKLERCQKDMYGQAGATGKAGVHAASEVNTNK